MLYQKLLTGVAPYVVNLGKGSKFRLHCHPEIELSYCVHGIYNICIDHKEYSLSKGDLAVVNPMSAHELGDGFSGNCLRLTIEVGPAFLGKQFDSFVSLNPRDRIFSLKASQDDPLFTELASLLDETADFVSTRPPFYDLSVKGNLYKISALLLQIFARSQGVETVYQSLLDIEKIGRAIQMIYNCYNEHLDLDAVSALCGYSKSNFCKTFKRITGSSFHTMLNRHRIDIACFRLKTFPDSIENIALGVGFADSKSFCRVFKKQIGMTAGEYRKQTAEA